MSDKELQLHIRAVLLLLLVMAAVAMMGEVYRQNWDSKVTAFPTKTEEAIELYARRLLGDMTTEEKVGQMFFAMNTCDAERAAELGLGGLLLGSENLDGLNTAEVGAVVTDFQTASRLPLFIGVCEEGGAVNTVSQYKRLRKVPFLSPSELVTTGGMELVEADACDKCAFLRELGVNVNFAPVCDVVTEETAFLYGRALNRTADATARYAETVVEAMNDCEVIAGVKHFPGYGDLPSPVGVDSRPMEVFETADFLPFRQSIKAGAQMVMTGHSVVTAMDADAPASLSRQVHTILRRSFGFDGVIISDDLSTSGLERYGDPAELAVRAVQAGSDMLLTPDFEIQIPAVVRAVRDGEIAVERIDESVLRILKLKIGFNILS